MKDTASFARQLSFLPTPILTTYTTTVEAVTDTFTILPMAVISITSSSHFRTVTSSSTYTVVDFYADWCGPCKTIAPIYEQLAAAESKPGRIVFTKVNVDSQSDVAGQYGVSAMPTFLILKGTSVKETVKGANPTALRTAVLSAAADAARGSSKAGPSFGGKGHTLGSASGGSSASNSFAMPDLSAILSSPASWSQGRGILQTLLRFIVLYLTTLFSLVPVEAAEKSSFAINTQQGQRLR